MQNNEPSDESWLTNHEEDFTQSVEADHEVAIRRLDKEKEQSIKKIWTYFEDSAQFITQLYKGRWMYWICLSINLHHDLVAVTVQLPHM